METHTPRDRVYLGLFKHLVMKDETGLESGVVVPDLIDDVDAEEETVQGVLRTLTEAGVLVERTERGHLADSEETCPVYYTAQEGPLGPIGAIPPAEDIHEEYDEETLEEIREQLGL